MRSCGLRGLEGLPVQVEVDIAAGLPSLTLVGLGDRAVQESRDRVRAALRHVAGALPARRITVNLAPASAPKVGPGFDLPIAAALLGAMQGVGPELLAGTFVGELGLDGSLRHLDGVLPVARAVAAWGHGPLYCPAVDAPEAVMAGEDLEVRPVAHLRDLLASWAAGGAWSQPAPRLKEWHAVAAPASVDLAQVRGQGLARRALEVAAAGGHNLLLVGPPGAGKTMLARALPGLLPPLGRAEALEVTEVHSLAGLLPAGQPLVRFRPFRAPHHSASAQALTGGGTAAARPGEISLAHRGVLFLDELAEFTQPALQALRQPLEEGWAEVARVGGRVRYPASCQLVAATNPCPCGHGAGSARCRCSPQALERYDRRLSGPLLDRIDMWVDVAKLPLSALRAQAESESSATVAARVAAARERQRLRNGEGTLNSRLPTAGLASACALEPGAERELQRCAGAAGLSARGYHRALRVARTIADLEERERVSEEEVLEAVGYRGETRAA